MDRYWYYVVSIPEPERPIPMFTARDKVALLIGNGVYLSERKLNAPPNDVLKIGEKLKSMNFKTIICKDLSKAHMLNVIDFFINLLIEGVYGKILLIIFYPFTPQTEENHQNFVCKVFCTLLVMVSKARDTAT